MYRRTQVPNTGTEGTIQRRAEFRTRNSALLCIHIIIYACNRVLKRSIWITYKRWCINLITFIALLFIGRQLNFSLNTYSTIVITCVPYTIATITVFFGVAFLIERETAQFIFGILSNRINRGLGMCNRKYKE